MPTVLALSGPFLFLRFWEPFFRTLKETNGNGFALSRKFQTDQGGSGEGVSDKEINRSARGSPAGLDAKTVKVNPLINRNENWFSAQKIGQVFILFKLVEIVFFHCFSRCNPLDRGPS